MRNGFAALCFAGLVLLAIATVTIRARNRVLRAGLAQLQAERSALRLESERLRVLALRQQTPEMLAQRLRDMRPADEVRE